MLNKNKNVKKVKTYMDKLMSDKEFQKKFNEEYQKFCIKEQVAEKQYGPNDPKKSK